MRSRKSRLPLDATHLTYPLHARLVFRRPQPQRRSRSNKLQACFPVGSYNETTVQARESSTAWIVRGWREETVRPLSSLVCFWRGAAPRGARRRAATNDSSENPESRLWLRDFETRDFERSSTPQQHDLLTHQRRSNHRRKCSNHAL